VGDSIRTGPNEFGLVYLFSHKDAVRRSTFVSIRTSENGSAALEMSPSHYVRLANGELRRAGSVRVGDALLDRSNTCVRVSSVDLVVKRGLFAPHTTASRGELVVNGHIVSEFTTAVHPLMARILLEPLKTLYRMGAYQLAGTVHGMGGRSLLASATESS